MTLTFDNGWWQKTVVANPMHWDETVLGIDWGESENAWCLIGYRGKVLARGSVREDKEGVAVLLDVLRTHAHPETGELPRSRSSRRAG